MPLRWARNDGGAEVGGPEFGAADAICGLDDLTGQQDTAKRTVATQCQSLSLLWVAASGRQGGRLAAYPIPRYRRIPSQRLWPSVTNFKSRKNK